MSSPIFAPFALRVREQRRREQEDQFMRSIREEQLAAQRARNAALTRQGDQRNAIMGMNARTSFGNLGMRQQEFEASQEQNDLRRQDAAARTTRDLVTSGQGEVVEPTNILQGLLEGTEQPDAGLLQESGDNLLRIFNPAQQMERESEAGMGILQQMLPRLREMVGEDARVQGSISSRGAPSVSLSPPGQARERTFTPGQQASRAVAGKAFEAVRALGGDITDVGDAQLQEAASAQAASSEEAGQIYQELLRQKSGAVIRRQRNRPAVIGMSPLQMFQAGLITEEQLQEQLGQQNAQ